MRLIDIGLNAIIQGHTGYSSGAAAVAAVGAFPVIAWLSSLGVNAAVAKAALKGGKNKPIPIQGMLARLPEAEKLTKRKATKFLGAGAHGAAFLTNKGDVLKLTLSPDEVTFASIKPAGKAAKLVVPIHVKPRKLTNRGKNMWAYVRAETKALVPKEAKSWKGLMAQEKRCEKTLGIQPITSPLGDLVPVWENATTDIGAEVKRLEAFKRGLSRFKGLRADLTKGYVAKGYVDGDACGGNFGKLKDGRIVARDIHVLSLGDAPQAAAWLAKKRKGRRAA